MLSAAPGNYLPGAHDGVRTAVCATCDSASEQQVRDIAQAISITRVHTASRIRRLLPYSYSSLHTRAGGHYIDGLLGSMRTTSAIRWKDTGNHFASIAATRSEARSHSVCEGSWTQAAIMRSPQKWTDAIVWLSPLTSVPVAVEPDNQRIVCSVSRRTRRERRRLP